MLMDARKLIADEYWDDGSYWIDLRRGWRLRGEAHGIVESTREAAHAKLDDVEPCDCGECKAIGTVGVSVDMPNRHTQYTVRDFDKSR